MFLNSNLYRILSKDNKYRIFIFKDSSELLQALEVFKYCKKIDKTFPNFYCFSDFRAKMGDDLRSYGVEFSELLINLHRFYNDNNAILLSPLHSVLNHLPKDNLLQGIIINKNQESDFNILVENLVCYGYEVSELVYGLREISIHGDIIDIFPPNYDNPIRISFFDNEIESIRYFDVVSQMCYGNELECVEIFPAMFSLSVDEFNEISLLCQKSDFDVFLKDIYSLGLWFIDGISLPLNYNTILSKEAKKELDEIKTLESLQKVVDFNVFKSSDTIEEDENFSDVIVEQNSFYKFFSLHKNKKKILLGSNKLLIESLNIPQDVEIIDSDICLNIITPSELILSVNKISRLKPKRQKKLVLNELNNGDYVVHEDYGIGVFRGIVQTSVLGNISDFIEIAYLNDDKLLLPTYNLNVISKYIAGTSVLPIVDRLGKGSFAKIKEKIRPKLLQIAKEIIDIAARRELIEGKKISIDDVEYLIFKENSGFELTLDQEKSINEILAELSSGRIMDRLLIGDVGFGKTEVAMNALFCVVKSGYQAALIVPTILLCLQHFNTLKSRFDGFGIKIARLDRYTKNKNIILQALKMGKIDIVIGTHSVLNANFSNLGLVVLDEEHKFGVKQKEQIKNLTKDVHILSMSATPIPRTLNMALSHIKTKSELNTPPSIRVAPKTFVKNYNDLLVKDAIIRELNRNGQVFYIHNNIASIYSKQEILLKLLPRLKIAILHSKIPQNKSEDIILGFANGDYDLLLCTSIVESGIHLPNANTIIVDSADRFGIADLHQLRGRVGRGNKEGYCYLFIESIDDVTPEARARLLSLESNSFLGAGGSLSYSDLEIRGGGNILGEAQSGHIKNIGYSLYLKMLEESINELSGKVSCNHSQSVDIKLNVSAFINPSIIPADRVRLDLYRRLSNSNTSTEVFEIEDEMVDRFGKLDNLTLSFLKLILIKVLANALNVKTIMNYNEHITIIYNDTKNEKLTSNEIDDVSVIDTTLAFLRNKFDTRNGK